VKKWKKIIKDKKLRGEWAESVFTVRAGEQGLRVPHPFSRLCEKGWACRTVSSGSGATFGAIRRNFIKPAPVAFPARFLKKSAAVSTTPSFSATAAAIH